MTTDTIDRLQWELSEMENWGRRTAERRGLPLPVREAIREAVDCLDGAQRLLNEVRPAAQRKTYFMKPNESQETSHPI